jgi:hypothetical protein
MAVGAEYHIETFRFSMNRYQASAENPASRTHWVIPRLNGAMMP